MDGKRAHKFNCGVRRCNREDSENCIHLMLEEPSIFCEMDERMFTEEHGHKYDADKYSWPLFTILTTIIELGFFVYYALWKGSTDYGVCPVPIDSLFIYHPDKRHEVWRFILYMVVHSSWFHLGYNLVAQLLFGVPIEMVHGSGRIAFIYLSGVLAGSLGTSIFDQEVYLVGASGGVYALMAAHLANIILNYNKMRFGMITSIVVILVFATFDVILPIYTHYSGENLFGTPVSHVAHLTGALAGITVGFIILKDFEHKFLGYLLWWIALGIYTGCMFFAIVYNILNSETVQRMKMKTI